MAVCIHTWYLSQAPQAVIVEKNLSCGETFPSDRLSCGEVSPHDKCGDKFCCHYLWWFVAKSALLPFTLYSLVVAQNQFCRDLRAFEWRKKRNYACGEKRTNMRYGCKIFIRDQHPTVCSASKQADAIQICSFLLLSAQLSLPYVLCVMCYVLCATRLSLPYVLTPWEVRSK